MTTIVEWSDEHDTAVFAGRLAQVVMPGDVICLSGELGAGKTTFTKYLAKALGIDSNIKSPTYTIIREYETERFPVYHMDAYRLEETGAEGMGLEEYIDGDGLSIIEWPQFVRKELGLNYLWITIDKSGEQARKLTLEGTGPRGKQLERLMKSEN